MITTYYGNVVLGSTALQTSVAEQEIIPISTKIFNFELLNDQICTISLNGGDYLYLRANQGITTDVVNSCKIKENNITYNWVGMKG